MHQSLAEFTSSIDTLLAHLEYERSSQTYFQEGVRKYTGDSDVEVEFRDFVKNKISPSLVSSKTFTYQNAIIALYGYLERFIENIIEEYLQNIREVCTTFSRLPSAIRRNHFNTSLDFLVKMQRVRGITPDQQKLKISNAVANMHSCFQEGSSYSINYDAFLMHNSNFRYDSIHEIFCKVGISAVSRKCLDLVDFAKAIAQKHNLDEFLDKKILISLLISELESLAQRRNEIAHGVRIDDIESIPLLKERISLIRAYGIAINTVAKDSYNLFLFDVSEKYSIGKPVKAFNNVHVLGFDQGETDNCAPVSFKISVGDMIFAVNESSTQKVISGRIKSIVTNEAATHEIDFPSNSCFAIKVDFSFNNHILNRSIYIIKLT